MEDEPVLRLNLGEGRQVEATRENSTAYTFLGQLGLYNHVFIVTDPEQKTGMYIFKNSPVFEQIFKYMGENAYPAHLNIPEVAQCDLNAFENMIQRESASDLEGGVPEGWV